MLVWAGALAGVLATWWVLFVLLFGMGFLAHRLARLGALDADSILLAVWIGIALTIALLQLWHFFLPVGRPAAALLGTLGLAGLTLARRELSAWASRSRRSVLLLVLLLCVVTFAADRAMGPLRAYDSGSYHIPVMEWARAYPVVPGLANLHGRLAFNNSSLLFAALLDDGPWAGRANHLVNGFFVALLLVQGVLHATRLPRATGAIRLRYAFDIAVLTPMMGILMVNNLVTSYAPDVAAGAALLAALSLVVGQAASGGPPVRARYELAAAAALLALTASIKLSLAFVTVLTWVIAFVLLWGRPRRDRAGRRVAAIAAVLASTAIMGPWLVRGTILSGYPLYPSTIVAAPVDWRVPVEQAHAELAWIGHFARTDGDSLEVAYPDRLLLGWEWLAPWSRQQLTDWRYATLTGQPAALALLLLTIVVALRVRAGAAGPGRNARPPEDDTSRAQSSRMRDGRSDAPLALWLLIAAAAAGSLFWFLTAPRVEFGFAPLWALAALCGALLFAHLPAGGRASARAIVAALALGISPVVGRVGYGVARFDDPLADRIINTLLVRRGSDHGFHPPDPPAEPVTTYVTDSGLLLYVPTETNRCFDAPLPCTPHPSPNLRMRGSDLGDGFRADGPWLAERWPNPDSRFLDSWRAYVAGEDTDGKNAVGHY